MFDLISRTYFNTYVILIYQLDIIHQQLRSFYKTYSLGFNNYFHTSLNMFNFSFPRKFCKIYVEQFHDMPPMLQKLPYESSSTCIFSNASYHFKWENITDYYHNAYYYDEKVYLILYKQHYNLTFVSMWMHPSL